MSELRSYGIVCKNEECRTAWIMGDMYVPNRESRGGDLVTFLKIKPGSFRCLHCGKQFDYTQDDVKEFPYLEGHP